MKKLLIAAGFVLGSLAVTQKADAQVRFGLNINIGDQPSWRAPGYNYVEYYYLPDIDAYYYVPGHQFIYNSGGRWIYSNSLPYQYRGYNLNTGYKVVINRRDAYKYWDQDRRKYRPRNKWNGNGYNNRDRDRDHDGRRDRDRNDRRY
jgi:hypothetical protein